MSNVAIILSIVVGLLTLVAAAAGIAAYFKKGLGDAIVDRYKEIHQADELRIEQLEHDKVDLERRVSVVESENALLKDMAIGRDILIQISGQIAESHSLTAEVLTEIRAQKETK